jgi:hypothetical protein
MLLAAPVNWLAIPRQGMPAALPQAAMELPPADPPHAAMPILAFFFAATWFVQGAMAAHLPGLLQAAGASASAAIAAASLVGPAQVVPASLSLGYCAPSTRSPRLGSLRRCTQLALRSLSRSVPPGSSHSRCCTAQGTA